MLLPQALIQNHPKKILVLKDQQGVVIVFALFIVAFVATMSYFMIARLERDIRRTTLILNTTQAEFYAQGSIAWALDELRNNFLKKKPNKLIDIMPLTLPPNERHGYKITSTIYDMQSRFNINNLKDEGVQDNFRQLLINLLPTLEDEKIRAIITAIKDWVTEGKEDSVLNKYYSSLPEPYRAPHKLMQSITELRLIKGITPEIFYRLKSYVAALPEVPTQINIQTASIPVLMSLAPNLTFTIAKSIEKLRLNKPIVNIDQFMGLLQVNKVGIQTKLVSTSSHFFLIETHVQIQEQEIILYSLVERKEQGESADLYIIWQSKNFPA